VEAEEKSAGMPVVLHQFEFSHFNDKVRWALAFKSIEHQRVSYLPGAHVRAITRLSGQQQTPVLQLHEHMIVGSADIIHALEQQYPQPNLYPADAQQCHLALAIQSRFDAEVGPAVRTALYSVLLREADYVVSMFAAHTTPGRRRRYRLAYPFTKAQIARANGVKDKKNVERAFAIFNRTLDQVAEQINTTGYLVGDQFSVADLTAAALLAPFANISHTDMQRPQPLPERVADVVGQFRHHPALLWVGNMYALHRS